MISYEGCWGHIVILVGVTTFCTLAVSLLISRRDFLREISTLCRGSLCYGYLHSFYKLPCSERTWWVDPDAGSVSCDSGCQIISSVLSHCGVLESSLPACMQYVLITLSDLESDHTNPFDCCVAVNRLVVS